MTVLILVSIYSCNENNVFDFSRNIEKIHGELIDIDCLIGRQPVDFTYIDTLLFFHDRYEQKLITIVDIKNDQCVGRYASEGRGPDEFLAPLRLFSSAQDKLLYCFEPNGGYVKLLGLPTMKTQRKILLQGDVSWVKKTRNYFVGFSPMEEGRFQLYDLDGNFLQRGGEYPFRGNEMDVMTAFALYQGSYCANPNEDYFAIGGHYCNSLEFYEIKNDKVILHKKYEIADAKGQMNNGVKFDNDCPIAYAYAYGTEKYCYMVYIGSTYAEAKNGTMPRKIRIFDWKGNYIKSYEPDLNIYAFCVDEDHHCIYGIVRNEQNKGEFEIMRFKM